MAGTKANILLIITDHHAFYDHDRPDGRPPSPRPMASFDRLAAGGIRFDRAYAVSPLCTPSRASMLTGRLPSAHGLIWNTDALQPGGITDFRPGEALYGDYLASVGYRNAYVGKWHCGHDRLPTDYGIEGWSLPDYGQPYMSDAYRSYCAQRGLGAAAARIEHSVDHPEWEGQRHVLHHQSPWRFMNGSGVLDGPPEAHHDQFTAFTAIEKLRELAAGEQPWSLVASFWGPHQPYYPTEPYASMYDPAAIPEYPSFRDDYSGNKPMRAFVQRDQRVRSAARWPEWSTWQQVLARAYGQVAQTDAAVGMLLDALDTMGVADDTLVIWVADHGDALASHGGLFDKASTCLEEVLRIPMAMRWPARFGPGSPTEALVTNMDVTATLLAAAGVAAPEGMHSRNLLPICEANSRAERVSWPDQIVCEHHGHLEDLLLRACITERFKYVAAIYDKDELYDLRDDPYEVRNLVDDAGHAAVAREMRGRLVQHLAQVEDPRADGLAYALWLHGT